MSAREHMLSVILRIAWAAIATLALAGPARAQLFDCCGPNGLTFDAGETILPDADYTIPSNGQAYIASYRLVSADPGATVFLDEPTQVDSFYLRRTVDDTEVVQAPSPIYTFSRSFVPGLVSYYYRGPKDFDRCADAGPVGEICASISEVFGNGTSFRISSVAPVTVFFSERAVPEPAVWMLMVAGFGIVGAGLRRRRAVAQCDAPITARVS